LLLLATLGRVRVILRSGNPRHDGVSAAFNRISKTVVSRRRLKAGVRERQFLQNSTGPAASTLPPGNENTLLPPSARGLWKPLLHVRALISAPYA
jgi:hypothetical protein